jgi:hypothetical protein
MGKVSGVGLIVAGLAVAAYALPQGGQPGEPDFGQFTEVEGTTAPVTSPRANPTVVVAESKPASRPPRVAAEPAPSLSAPVVVTISPRLSEPPPPRTAALPRDRDSIGRELQKELKRVGCYEGELNGVWTAPTRQAMKAFTDRVNAVLPTDEPDNILLTMVRGYQDRVCGKPCPAGQGLGEGGRCVPNAILVRAPAKPSAPTHAAPDRKPEPAITGWTTITATDVRQPTGAAPPEGRMALAGPTAESPPSPQVSDQPTTLDKNKRSTDRPKTSPTTSWARSIFRNQGSLN